MILVTLGTHDMPMDRLLRELDRLVASGVVTEPVVVQTAALNFRPVNLETRPILPFPELEQMVREAAVVVSHAGPGNLAVIRRAGKIPVVVPRSRRHREHVDDHQERYALRLVDVPGYIVVTDMSQLAGALREGRGRETGVEAPDLSLAIRTFEEIIECT